MYQEIIDPPADVWGKNHLDTLDWLDDLAREYAEDEAAALHSFECRVYNELDRR